MFLSLHRSLWRTLRQFSPLSLMTLGLLSVSSAPSLADSAEQATQFYSFPRLVYTGTNRDQTYARSATYYFTLTFPPSDGAALGTIDLIQTEGLPITLVPQKTIAFEGTRRDREADIPLTVEPLADEEQTGLRIYFDEPVQPGHTITLAVRARSNPYQDGVYLYQLVAYPHGNKNDGYTLGTARLHFYESIPFRL